MDAVAPDTNAAPDGDGIALAIEGRTATIRLDRPERRNALDAAMVAALHEACRRIDRDAGIRAVIVHGTGGKAFCAGGDIEAWSALPASDFARRWVRDGHDAFDALARLAQPVIAVIDGHALGGGLELAACADLRIMEAHAKVGQPETGLGIIAGWSGTQRCVRRFGASTVRRMALFGEVLNAEEALRLRVVDRIVPQGEGIAAAREIAQRLATRGPLATAVTKMAINVAEGEERERALDAVAGLAIAQTEDLREGVDAFGERREARFGGG